VLAPPQGPVQGGETVIVDLYLHNNTDATIIRELPRSLPCRIVTGQSTVTVNADLAGQEVDSQMDIPGRGFAKRQYAVTLPVYAIGAVRIIPETIDTNPLIIQVEKASPEAWVGQQVPLDEGPTMFQSYLEDLSVHEPMYFLLGVDPGLDQSKFQFSFKYRLFNPKGYLAEKAPWVTGFHLGYTQRSVWDLKGDSKPFEDTSYMPEAFYLLPKIDLNLARISAFGIQGGFQHESNGTGGTDSRSTNYLYVKPIMGVHLAGPFHMKIAPKIYTYVENEDENNGDLADYRGYVDLQVGIINPEGIALNSHLWWARKGASVQLDLTYPMTRLLGKSFNFYLQAQYFSGYAETLIHYNERHDAFRLGFSIVR
jgi:outer membrane phospholipase A